MTLLPHRDGDEGLPERDGIACVGKPQGFLVQGAGKDLVVEMRTGL